MSKQYIYQLFISKSLKIEDLLLALFYYISKALKIDCCKLWTAASYFWASPESIFKDIRGFLTKEKSVIDSLR